MLKSKPVRTIARKEKASSFHSASKAERGERNIKLTGNIGTINNHVKMANITTGKKVPRIKALPK
jgi:hypothetical protein